MWTIPLRTAKDPLQFQSQTTFQASPLPTFCETSEANGQLSNQNTSIFNVEPDDLKDVASIDMDNSHLSGLSQTMNNSRLSGLSPTSGAYGSSGQLKRKHTDGIEQVRRVHLYRPESSKSNSNSTDRVLKEEELDGCSAESLLDHCQEDLVDQNQIDIYGGSNWPANGMNSFEESYNYALPYGQVGEFFWLLTEVAFCRTAISRLPLNSACLLSVGSGSKFLEILRSILHECP